MKYVAADILPGNLGLIINTSSHLSESRRNNNIPEASCLFFVEIRQK